MTALFKDCRQTFRERKSFLDQLWTIPTPAIF
jgi:hypothetical protein